MNGTRRMQFNINVVNDSDIKSISAIHPLVYPMIWVNEVRMKTTSLDLRIQNFLFFQHAEIDQANANIFHKKVSTPLAVLAAIKYIFLTIGILLFITMIGLVIYKRSQVQPEVVPVAINDETTPLIQ